MTTIEEHDLTERMRACDDAMWRHGYAAALAASHGRPAMERIRNRANARDQGGTDLLAATVGMNRAVRSLVRAISDALASR